MSAKAIVSTIAGFLLLLFAWFLFSSFVRPYDKPQYAEIDTSESAFLVPLEGDAQDQAQAATADFYEKHLVHVKRVQITHRWNQTGRWYGTGDWISSVRLIKVDRQPRTRKWLPRGTGTNRELDESIRAESKDSVGFSVGLEVTARVIDNKAATFLYYYSPKKAQQKEESGLDVTVTNVEIMMDGELRTKIHEIFTREAGKYDMDDLRAKKNDILTVIRQETIQFFKDRGVEITAISITGGINFDNPTIQKAIDDAAQQSQLKVAEQMKLEAQQVTNKRLLTEADGRAAALKREKQGIADALVVEANGRAEATIKEKTAEAEGIKLVADAKEHELNKAKNDPVTYLALKRFEVELTKLKQWKGDVPQYLIEGSGDKSNLLVIPPSVVPKAEEKK